MPERVVGIEANGCNGPFRIREIASIKNPELAWSQSRCLEGAFKIWPLRSLDVDSLLREWVGKREFSRMQKKANETVLIEKSLISPCVAMFRVTNNRAIDSC